MDISVCRWYCYLYSTYQAKNKGEKKSFIICCFIFFIIQRKPGTSILYKSFVLLVAYTCMTASHKLYPGKVKKTNFSSKLSHFNKFRECTFMSLNSKMWIKKFGFVIRWRGRGVSRKSTKIEPLRILLNLVIFSLIIILTTNLMYSSYSRAFELIHQPCTNEKINIQYYDKDLDIRCGKYSIS